LCDISFCFKDSGGGAGLGTTARSLRSSRVATQIFFRFEPRSGEISRPATASFAARCCARRRAIDACTTSSIEFRAERGEAEAFLDFSTSSPASRRYADPDLGIPACAASIDGAMPQFASNAGDISWNRATIINSFVGCWHQPRPSVV
jgi:hypothetical protein